MGPPTRATEESIRPTEAVSGSNLPHIPRRWVRDAIRVCMDLGYTVSGAEAWRLLKEWRNWRERDAREFVASEFGAFVQRRGDLLIVRGKAHHPWRVTT
jgi:hypothetical protein